MARGSCLTLLTVLFSGVALIAAGAEPACAALCMTLPHVSQAQWGEATISLWILNVHSTGWMSRQQKQPGIPSAVPSNS